MGWLMVWPMVWPTSLRRQRAQDGRGRKASRWLLNAAGRARGEKDGQKVAARRSESLYS